MFRSFLTSAFFLLCIFALAIGQSQQTQPAQQTQQQTALPPEAINEPVRAIKAPRAPLPSEKDSAGVNRFSFIVYGDTRGRRDGFELQYEHSLIVNSSLAAIKRLEKTPFPVRFVIQTGDGVANGAIGRQWNASYVDLINRLTQEGGASYFLAPGNHDVSSAATHGDPRRQPGLKNFFSANAELIPPEGSPRRLAGYPVFSFGYGNAFFIAFDSNIAGDEKQFEWIKAQLEGLDRIAKPPYEPGDGAYHYVLAQVDGDRISLEVIGVDWGRNYQPYGSNKADLSDKE